MASNLVGLPAPDVLETLDYDEIFAQILVQFRDLNPDYTSIIEGDPAYTVLQAMAWQEIMTRKRINDAARAVLVTHAIGADLDNIGILFAIERQVITEADPDAEPPVEEVREDDVRFRDRILNALEAIAPGSKAWYRGYALEASPAVKDAVAVRTAPGEITVYVQANNESAIPDNNLIEAVCGHLTVDERRFLCDDVFVEAIQIKSYKLIAEIKPIPGLDAEIARKEVEARAHTLVAESQRIDVNIPLSQFYCDLLTDSVREITLIEPTENVVTKQTEVPVADIVDVTVGEQEDDSTCMARDN